MKKLRIVYLGTPEFAATCLETLLNGRHEVVGVVTAPDRESGRGRIITQSDVKKIALERGLPIAQPERLRSEEFLDLLKGWNADLGVVVAFRMLPEVVWSMPEMGTVNLHGSLLPQFRGAAPIQRAIMAGATESGATTFLLTEDIDMGDMLGQVVVPIGPNENAGSLHDRILESGKNLLAKTVDDIADGVARAIPQSDVISELNVDILDAHKLFKEDRKISWLRSAADLHNHIRGLAPYPGAFTTLPDAPDAPVKILEAQVINDRSGELEAGEISIHEGRLFVGCGKPVQDSENGTLEILRIQPPGKGAMDAGSYLRGLRDEIARFTV
ncbi:MAG: methionyl-tRNA formyltransferase [Flavobacteriales bacterium]|jgi:methionyl-tRNA formyltransferase|nr:methionyl-tRNA formyltransferase [Flavobacteriales bacterium]MBT6174883.1 methionyl-tRNA formyltransferase [Flavobacteriales bacterium]